MIDYDITQKQTDREGDLLFEILQSLNIDKTGSDLGVYHGP